MARKKIQKTVAFVDPASVEVPETEIMDIAVERYTEFLIASNERAVPDARDGLKPVHRRILLSFHDNGASATSRHFKSVKIVGDCFAAGTLVSTPSGLRAIEMLDVGDLVTRPGGGAAVVTAAYANPAAPMARITLSDGRTIDATPDQLFRVVDADLSTAWQPAQSLVGSRVVLAGHNAQPLAGSEADREAYVLGLFVAEGFAVHRSRSADGRSRINMVDPEPLEVVESWAKSAGFGCSRSVRSLEDKGYQNQHVLTIARNDILGPIVAPLSAQKTIPDQVMNDRGLWLPFLSGFFDGDGHVGNQDRRRLIEFATTSDKITRSIQSLLGAMGVRFQTYKQTSRDRDWNDLHSIEVTGADASRLAVDLLPFVTIARKRDALASVTDVSIRRRGHQDSDRIGMAAVWNAFTAAHRGGGWFRGLDGSAFRFALDGAGQSEIRYGRQSNTGTLLADREFSVSRAIAGGWAAKLDAIASPLGARLCALGDMTFVDVKSVEILPDHAPNYDIRIDSDDHAFLVEGIIVHNCLGRYHPHGDTSVYDAAVKMSQDFALRYPLVEGKGNFGNIDGDGAAAYRYTEMRTDAVGDAMLADLENKDADVVDWGGNFTNEFDEPKCLPGRFPQLLCNGILTGIGTGYSAMWLPHNLREVVDAVLAVIADPRLEASALAKYIKGPDFPTGGIVMGTDGFKAALETGRGSVTVRAKMAIEEDGKETRIVISEIPWQKEKTALQDAIKAAGTKDKTGKAQIEGITGVEDQTGNDWLTEMRLVVNIRKDASPKVIANLLYKYTGLQTTFSYNQMAYVDGYPKMLTTLDAIKTYIAHQFDVVTRRTKFHRRKAVEFLEVQEAFILADKYADKIVPMARASANREELEKKLPTIVPTATAVQCKVIAGMPLYRFSKIDTAGTKVRIVELKAEIAEYDRLLGSKPAMTELLVKEIREIKTKFGDDRRTEINSGDNGEIKTLEELIPDDACWLTLAKSGLIGRLAESAIKAQKRGGAGISAARSDDDPIIQTIGVRTREKVWLLTDKGNLFSARVMEIDEMTRGGRGTNVKRFLSLGGEEQVVKVVAPPADLSGEVVIATANGKVLRAKATDYTNLNSAGLGAIKVLGDDRIVSAFPAKAGMHLIAISSDGYAARFDMADLKAGIPIQGRNGQGVGLMNLTGGAKIVSLSPIAPDDKGDFALVLSNGKGKKSRLTEYPTKSRGVRGVITVDLGTASKGKASVAVVFAAPLADSDQVLFTTSSGKVIAMAGSEVKRQGRATAGVNTVALSSSAKNPETVLGGNVA